MRRLSRQTGRPPKRWRWIALLVLGALVLVAGYLAFPNRSNRSATDPLLDQTSRTLNQLALRFFPQHPPELRARYQKNAEQLVAERQQRDQTIWADEVVAQAHEQPFVALWDQLRAASDKFGVLGNFPFRVIQLGRRGDTRNLPVGIQVAQLTQAPHALDHDQWLAFLAQTKEQGYRLVQSEWHHARFVPGIAGPPQSTFDISLHITRARQNERFEITGPIRVVWSDQDAAGDPPVPARIDATGLTVKWRQGPPIFERVELARLPVKFGWNDLLGCDLNLDGQTDLVYPASNWIFWNRGAGRFDQQSLCEHPAPVVLLAVLADFTGDGKVDYLAAGKLASSGPGATPYELLLWESDAAGHFSLPPRRVADPTQVELRMPSCFAVGDVDGDRDLDIYLVQYKPAYGSGSFPKVYYDANDGYPAYLLLNSGDGRFVDATDAAGLSAKRFRRSYRSSLIDLDNDNDLDLMVVNDYSGLDVHFNDGHGHFSAATDSTVDRAATFGMAHTFADFNADGRLDFYVTGMASTTARRLQDMGLGRDDRPLHTQRRTEMAYGNRLYLAEDSGGFRQPAFGRTVARSGWTWGCMALDVNNDTYPEIYVANGHMSGQTAKDYCSRFWRHDIYAGGDDDPAQQLVLKLEMLNWIQGWSWNGFEKNHLFLNLAGQDFVNVAFLMGAALEQDCRIVIADDFDLDGRMDLAVTSLEPSAFEAGQMRPPKASRLQLLFNRHQGANHWIGVRLRATAGVAPWGARIGLGYPGGEQVAAVVTGESFMAQHAPSKHFGLGLQQKVSFIEVRWPDGQITRLENPAVDRYHWISP